MPEGQTARWIQELGTYMFQVEHKQGKQHGNADGLSRLPCKQCSRRARDTRGPSWNSGCHLMRQGRMGGHVLMPAVGCACQNFPPTPGLAERQRTKGQRTFGVTWTSSKYGREMSGGAGWNWRARDNGWGTGHSGHCHCCGSPRLWQTAANHRRADYHSMTNRR